MAGKAVNADNVAGASKPETKPEPVKSDANIEKSPPVKNPDADKPEKNDTQETRGP